MKKIQLTALLISILNLCSWGQSSITQNKSTWETLDAAEYSIQYPKEWELNKSGQLGTKFFIFSPVSSANDKFRENVNLIIQDIKNLNIDLDKYVEISEEQIKTLIKNSEIVESKREKINDVECHKIIYMGQQAPFELEFEQIYFIKNEKAYILTFTSEKSEFSNYKETAEKILNSLKIK